MKPPLLRKREQEMDRSWVDQMLASAQRRNWHGTITIDIAKGEIKRVVPAQSLFPPSRGGKDLGQSIDGVGLRG